MSCYQPQRGKKLYDPKKLGNPQNIQAGDITRIGLMYSVCQICINSWIYIYILYVKDVK